MSYFVLGIALLVGAVWLLWIILTAIGKVVGKGIAAAHSLGTSTASGFRRTVRYASRKWVIIDIPRKLTELQDLIDQGRSVASALKGWMPEPIGVRQLKLTQFHLFRLPEERGVGTNIHLRDLDTLRQLTEPAPSSILENLASRDCEFSDQRPRIPSHETKWPDTLAPVTIALPSARFDPLVHDPIRRFIVRWAYDVERTVVQKTLSQIQAIARELETVNGLIAEANADVAKVRDAYRTAMETVVKSDLAAYKAAKEAYTKACCEETAMFIADINAYKQGNTASLLAYFNTGLRLVALPVWFSNKFNVGFDPTAEALIIEIELPNLPEVVLQKTVVTSTGKVSERPANRKEATLALSIIHPLALLRLACETARLDTSGKLKLVVLNGWVAYRSKSTGQPLTAYIASLVSDPEELRKVSLPNVDVFAAFQHLRGQSAFVVDDVIAIKPQLVLNRDDPRFIAAKDVIQGLNSRTNLATMDWQDFEHLIRDLFERLYQGNGVEVKVTQASRDRGVDAVVLDPDPIRGGKTVIQAKRYVNTVDVSAVRDLYGTVHNEGASRGILVTTSSFGPDAYRFAEGKPLTLINGSQLLAYLKEAGKDVRIDLEEARRLANLQSH